MFLHLVSARYIGNYQVEVCFNDGRQGIADLSNIFTGPVFKPLKDPEMFAQLRLDKELDTLVWPNGADLAPEYLYFRAFRNEPGLEEKFRKWGYLTETLTVSLQEVV